MKKSLLLLLAFLSLGISSTNAAKLEDYLDRKEVQKKISEAIIEQDINFKLDLGSIDLVEGIDLSTKYKYEVEASYIDKFYTRIDKWDVKAGINVGEVINNLVELPFSFNVARNTSFYFVRQFAKKNDAIKALPYTPAKLPLNANMALKNLMVGDFVSMPASMNIAVGIGGSTSMVTPVVLSANAGVYYVLSGEFIIQVFKLDDTHVRLKLLSKRGRDTKGSAGVGVSFKFFGIRILDRQIDRLFERDLAQYGYSYNPGAQFIVDYVFDLKNPEAQEAYNQILSSTLKFKDVVAADLIDAQELKDKLISSYEKADALSEADKKLEAKDRRVQRIFKGFNNYKGHTRHLKFSFLITDYTKDRTLTESKLTFIDKNEHSLEFFYPTYSKYIETNFGKWIFELKDQSFQNNFALIPRFNLEDSSAKNPDIGLTFERKDKVFTPSEQRAVEKFMISQLPAVIAKDIDLSQWKDGVRKLNSRIFFQLVLKAQGIPYLKNIPAEVMKEKLIKYVEEKSKIQILEQTNTKRDKLTDFLFVNRFIKKDRLEKLAASLTKTLLIENSEQMAKKLVALNEFGSFDKIGIGFLMSLLPQDKLKDLVFVKLDMIGKDLKPISAEYGILNYRVLYNELNQIQSRLANRGFDLRLSDADRDMGDLEIEAFPEEEAEIAN